MITQLKKELREFYTVKKINNLVEKMENEKRNGHPRFIDPYFRNKHIERVLYRILERNKDTLKRRDDKLAAGEGFRNRMIQCSFDERGEA